MINYIIVFCVVLLMGLIIYFRFIKNRGNSCSQCSEVKKCQNKGKELRRYYKKNCKK